MLLFALFCFSVNSQVTYLDSSFNSIGLLSVNPEGGEDIPATTLIRANGKSLVIGRSYFASRIPPETRVRVSVAQFDIDGKPDHSFGQEGVVILDKVADGVSATLQPDGKLVILGGYLENEGNNTHFLVRLKEDGTLDTDFGEMGVTSHPDTMLQTIATGVLVQPDGSIVVGGFTEAAISQMFLMKFTPDGLVDSSFGTNGVIFSDVMRGLGGFAVSQEGWIFAGGWNNNYEPLLMRYLPNGELDVTFGTGGAVKIPGNGFVGQVIVQPDGKIIVAGSGSNYFIFRLMPDGAYDPDFDDFITPNGYSLMGVALQADGSIFGIMLREYFDVITFRYLPSGQFDYSQITELDFPIGSGFILQSDGKILLVPYYSDEFGFSDFSLVRLAESLELDLSYGQNGFAAQNIGTNYSEISSVMVDDQDRILFGGSAAYTQYYTDPPNVESAGFVGRVQANGVPDSSFWHSGLKGLPNASIHMNLFARQSDGKIIIAGSTSEYGNLIVVNRILQNGAFDPEFGDPFGNPGSSYCELSSFGITETQARAVAVGPDKDILVMSRVVDQNQLQKIAIVRFDSTGTLDASFGISGVVLSSGNIIPGDFELRAGLVQPDGKILLGGTYGVIPNIFLLRFLPDGTLDNTFSSDGRVFKPFSGTFYHLNGLALALDGSILITGSQGVLSNSNIIVGRLNPDGSQDITFNEDGLIVVNIGAVEYGSAVAVQGDAKIVVAGTRAGSVSPEDNDPVFIRLLPDGHLDTSFAGLGYVVTDLPGDNGIKAIAVQPNGNYIAAGYSNNDYLLVRYLSKLNVGLIDPSSTLVEMLVYPNPIKAFVTVSYTLQNPSNVSIELLDIQGKHRHSFLLQEKRQVGEQTELINIPSTLSPGVYLLRIQTEYGSKTVRVLFAE